MSDAWCSDIEMADQCPEMKDKGKIILDAGVYDQISAIIDAVKHNEFLAYLYGKETDDGYVVNKISIPYQEVTAATVKVKQPERSPGVLHKHPGSYTNPRFSGVDDDNVNLNHEFSIVINEKREMYAEMRKKVKCGLYVTLKPEIVIGKKKISTKFIGKIADRIRKKSYCYSGSNARGNSNSDLGDFGCR